MPYLSIADFKLGQDRRRAQINGVPGTLWTLKNAVVSRGGDIQRVKKFVSKYSLPSGTFGAAAVKGAHYVFGSASTPSGIPVGVTYQQLAAPDAAAMSRILDAKAFDGKVYVVAEYVDGDIYHFYDGSRVTDWDALADANSSYAAVAAALARKITANAAVKAEAFGATVKITAQTPGTSFTIATSVTDGGTGTTPAATRTQVTANVAAVAEVRATGSVEILTGSADPGTSYIDQITVNSVELLAEPVNWSGSNSVTANLVAIAINNNAAVSGYSATAVGAVVTISADPGTGATPNGYVVETTVAGDVTTTDIDMAGGVTEVAAVAQVEKVVISAGSFDGTDQWVITINSTDYKVTGRGAGTNTALMVTKGRVWAIGTNVVIGCKLNDATDWSDTDASTGYVLLGISTDSSGAQQLVAAATYQDKVAIFAEEAIPFYLFDTDASNIEAAQEELNNTGALAAGAVVPYGNTDVFYLDSTGVRSIRTRSGYNAAYVDDVGSAIDPFIQDLLAAASEDTIARSVAVIDPEDGRYLLAIGSTIVALSYFPSAKITAWSYFEPGFTVTALYRSRRQLFARGGDVIYVYGGDDGDEYPAANEQIPIAETAFMTANDPAGIKDFKGFDMASSGTWLVEVMVDPNDTSKVVTVGHVSKPTYNLPDFKIPGRGSHFGFRFTGTSAGAATVSSAALHYEREKAA